MLSKLRQAIAKLLAATRSLVKIGIHEPSSPLILSGRNNQRHLCNTPLIPVKSIVTNEHLQTSIPQDPDSTVPEPSRPSTALLVLILRQYGCYLWASFPRTTSVTTWSSNLPVENVESICGEGLRALIARTHIVPTRVLFSLKMDVR